jgi:hypothetical protein
MRLISTNNKDWLLGALWRVCVAFLMVFVLLFGMSGLPNIPIKYLLAKEADASNIYFDDVSFHTDSEGYNRLSFHMLTSLDIHITGAEYCVVKGYAQTNDAMVGGVNQDYGFGWVLPEFFTDGNPCSTGNMTLTAGNTYDGYILSTIPNWPVAYDFQDFETNYLNTYARHIYSSSDWFETTGDAYQPYYTYNWSLWPFQDPEHYFFEELPSLTITFPEDNEELVSSFNITGSFTQPTADPSGFLQVSTMPAGTYSSSLQSFWQSIQSASSGAVSIWVSNLSAGYYDFRIYFRGGTFDFYEGAVIYNVHIVNDLPFSLPPTQGLPPFEIVPVYNELVCDTYYAENSTYETSTALFSNLCLTLSPVLLGVGGVLTQYSANFTPSNASSTGNQLGQSVVLLRSYLSNLNSFFNGFPVSQFLVLYLIALLIAILIRLIKNLIHLAKPV